MSAAPAVDVTAKRRWPPLKLQSSTVLLLGIAAVLALLVVFPLIFLVYGSFHVPVAGGLRDEFSLENYQRAYGDRSTYTALWNSIVYSSGHTLLAVVSGTFLAWVAERTNTPGRRYIYLLSVAPLIVPGILNTVAWVFLLSPRIGVINRLLMQVFGLDSPPFDIFSLPGMILESGLHWSPFVFLIMGAAFRSLDPSLEEAATIAGASTRRVLFGITFRLVGPALLSAVLIMFVRALSILETPLLLGVPAKYFVLTTEIYLRTRTFPPHYGLSAAYSILLMLIAMVGVYLYGYYTREAARFSTITGKGYRPRLMDLGRWKYLTAALTFVYFLLVLIIPGAVLFWFSLFTSPPSFTMADLENITLRSYLSALRMPDMARAVLNSVFLALASAVLVMLISLVISWLVIRTRMRGRWLLDNMASVPLIIPGVVLAMALIWTYTTLPIPIYGTLWILLLAYVTRYIPYGVRYASSSLIQVHRELEEAAHVSGASWSRTLRSILLPLLRSGMVGGAIYVILLSIKEFSTSLLLYTSGNEVVSVLFYDLWAEGFFNELAAIGVLFMAMLVLIVFSMQKLGSRYGVQVE